MGKFIINSILLVLTIWCMCYLIKVCKVSNTYSEVLNNSETERLDNWDDYRNENITFNELMRKENDRNKRDTEAEKESYKGYNPFNW